MLLHFCTECNKILRVSRIKHEKQEFTSSPSYLLTLWRGKVGQGSTGGARQGAGQDDTGQCRSLILSFCSFSSSSVPRTGEGSAMRSRRLVWLYAAMLCHRITTRIHARVLFFCGFTCHLAIYLCFAKSLSRMMLLLHLLSLTLAWKRDNPAWRRQARCAWVTGGSDRLAQIWIVDCFAQFWLWCL